MRPIPEKTPVASTATETTVGANAADPRPSAAAADGGPAAPFDSAQGPDAGSPARSQAISALFQEHNRALINFLRTRLPDEQEAREAAQEAYVKLLQLDQPVTVSTLRWYLFKIARCIAIDRRRQHFTRTRLDRLDNVDDFDLSTSTEDRVMAADELSRLLTALKELPTKCQQAFLLHRLHGLSTVEVGQRIGLTDRMVRLHVKKALIYCRFRLEGLTPAQAREKSDS